MGRKTPGASRGVLQGDVPRGGGGLRDEPQDGLKGVGLGAGARLCRHEIPGQLYSHGFFGYPPDRYLSRCRYGNRHMSDRSRKTARCTGAGSPPTTCRSWRGGWRIRSWPGGGTTTAPWRVWSATSARASAGRSPGRIVVSLDGRPVGLVQRSLIHDYPEDLAEFADLVDVPEGAVELDYLIGEPALRGRGLGSRMIAALVRDTWAVPTGHPGDPRRRRRGQCGLLARTGEGGPPPHRRRTYDAREPGRRIAALRLPGRARLTLIP